MDLTKFGVKESKPKSIFDSKLTINVEEIQENLKQEDVEYFLPWFIKYQISEFDQLVQTKEMQKIHDFFNGKSKKKGLVLVGKAGSGKTTTLTLFAKKLQLELFEMNASDSRNKNSIQEHLEDVLKQKSLFGKEKLILIDEVDGVSGTKDRGGIPEIIKYLKDSPYKIVFTANDKESNAIKSLKKVCEIIDFEVHSKELLLTIGERILQQEGIEYSREELSLFTQERDNPDIRGFINDLQISVLNGRFQPFSSLELRSYKKKIDQVLSSIFYSHPDDALEKSYESDIPLDDLFLYIEENLPKVYQNVSLQLGMNELSKADIFKGRILKWQYWRYLVYVNFYLTYGISASKRDSDIISQKGWKKNSRILKKWILGNKIAPLKPRTKLQKEKDLPLSFIEEISKYYGVSTHKFHTECLPYFLLQYKKDENFKKYIDTEFRIDSKTEKLLLELR
jgi:replication factor C large subunit